MTNEQFFGCLAVLQLPARSEEGNAAGKGHRRAVGPKKGRREE